MTAIFQGLILGGNATQVGVWHKYFVASSCFFNTKFESALNVADSVTHEYNITNKNFHADSRLIHSVVSLPPRIKP